MDAFGVPTDLCLPFPSVFLSSRVTAFAFSLILTYFIPYVPFFQHAHEDIKDHTSAAQVDMVISLHACDTATDYALMYAVSHQAKAILAVPCCQHELNGQMQGGNLPLLTRYGLVKERNAALMTDAIRANLLTACGYKSQVLEFIDMEHTSKNILLRGLKASVSPTAKTAALKEVKDLCAAFHFNPSFFKAFRG